MLMSVPYGVTTYDLCTFTLRSAGHLLSTFVLILSYVSFFQVRTRLPRRVAGKIVDCAKGPSMKLPHIVFCHKLCTLFLNFSVILLVNMFCYFKNFFGIPKQKMNCTGIIFTISDAIS